MSEEGQDDPRELGIPSALQPTWTRTGELEVELRDRSIAWQVQQLIPAILAIPALLIGAGLFVAGVSLSWAGLGVPTGLVIAGLGVSGAWLLLVQVLAVIELGGASKWGPVVGVDLLLAAVVGVSLALGTPQLILPIATAWAVHMAWRRGVVFVAGMFSGWRLRIDSTRLQWQRIRPWSRRGRWEGLPLELVRPKAARTSLGQAVELAPDVHLSANRVPAAVIDALVEMLEERARERRADLTEAEKQALSEVRAIAPRVETMARGSFERGLISGELLTVLFLLVQLGAFAGMGWSLAVVAPAAAVILLRGGARVVALLGRAGAHP